MNPDGTEYMGTILIGNVEGDDVYIDTDKDELCNYSSIKIMDCEFSYLPEIQNWSAEKEYTIHLIPIKKIVKLDDGKDIAEGLVVPIPEETMYYEPESNRVYSCNFCGDTGKIEKLCSPEDNSCYGFAWDGECIDDVLVCSEFIVWDDDEPIRDGPSVHLCKKRYYPKTITFTLDRFTFSRAYKIDKEILGLYPHNMLKKYYDKILYFSQDTGCIYLVYTKQNPDLSDYIEILPIGKVEGSSAYLDKSTEELCDYTRIKLSYIGDLPKSKYWYEEKIHSVNLFRIKKILEVGSIDGGGGSDGGGSDSKEIFMMEETMYYDTQSKRVRTIYFSEDTCLINKDCFGWHFTDCYGFAWNGEYNADTLVCSKFDT
tara:strand:- start:345 stop:1457 length:1113 start_codon:yes stop_codon:yes gene_type:complete